MSYEPNAHPFQVSILRHLLFTPSASFAELQKTTEARLVRTLDKWDPSFSHLQDGGQALFSMGVDNRDEFEVRCEETRRRIMVYGGEFPDAMAIRQTLLEKVADVAYASV